MASRSDPHARSFVEGRLQPVFDALAADPTLRNDFLKYVGATGADIFIAAERLRKALFSSKKPPLPPDFVFQLTEFGNARKIIVLAEKV